MSDYKKEAMDLSREGNLCHNQRARSAFGKKYLENRDRQSKIIDADENGKPSV